MKANCALKSCCTISPVISVEVCGRAGCSALVNLSCAAQSVSAAAAASVGNKDKAHGGALLLLSSLKTI